MNKTNYLPCITLEPKNTADACVIWLHGLGADGHDFEAIVPELHLPEDLSIRFVFPNAPKIPVSINGGMVMPAWYDILGMGNIRDINKAQLLDSAIAVQDLIDREIEKGIASSRIILAGFSQGGAVNYQAALTYPQPLAGLLALSTYFPTDEGLVPHAANKAINIKIYHGSMDPVVNISLAEKAIEDLSSLGYQSDYKTYAMEHSVCPEEVADIATWFQDVLSKKR